ncbi:MAG: hypothetical protein ACUVQR_03380 [Thermogutta sp.]
MRYLGYLTMATILLAVSTPTWAEDQEKEATSAAGATSGQAAALSAAQQRAEWLKTLAAIAEEEAKPQPDTKRIAELRAQLLEMRQNRVATFGGPGMGAPGRPPVPPACPLGGPGLGMGMGRGPGFAAGMNYGRGPGGGGQRGAGFRSGYRQGPGGYGAGASFVDRNRNGICDYYEFRWGQ